MSKCMLELHINQSVERLPSMLEVPGTVFGPRHSKKKIDWPKSPHQDLSGISAAVRTCVPHSLRKWGVVMRVCKASAGKGRHSWIPGTHWTVSLTIWWPQVPVKELFCIIQGRQLLKNSMWGSSACSSFTETCIHTCISTCKHNTHTHTHICEQPWK